MQIDRACFAIRSSAMRLSLKYFTCGYGIGWKLLAIRFVENFGTGEERGWKFPKFIASSINAFRCLRLWCVVRSMVESDLKKSVLNYIKIFSRKLKKILLQYSKIFTFYLNGMDAISFKSDSLYTTSGKPTHSLIMFIVRISFLNLLQGTSFQPYSK